MSAAEGRPAPGRPWWTEEDRRVLREVVAEHGPTMTRRALLEVARARIPGLTTYNQMKGEMDRSRLRLGRGRLPPEPTEEHRRADAQRRAGLTWDAIALGLEPEVSIDAVRMAVYRHRKAGRL